MVLKKATTMHYCDQVSYRVTEISPQWEKEWELSHLGPPGLGVWPSPRETDLEKMEC